MYVHTRVCPCLCVHVYTLYVESHVIQRYSYLCVCKKDFSWKAIDQKTCSGQNYSENVKVTLHVHST